MTRSPSRVQTPSPTSPRPQTPGKTLRSNQGKSGLLAEIASYRLCCLQVNIPGLSQLRRGAHRRQELAEGGGGAPADVVAEDPGGLRSAPEPQTSDTSQEAERSRRRSSEQTSET